MTPSAERILIAAGHAPSLLNFRGALIANLRAAGVEVYCTAPEDDPAVVQQLATVGARYEAVGLQRAALSVASDLRYAFRMYRLCRRLRPTLVLAYTIKPIAFGLTAARLAGIRRRFALVTGLGYAFTGGGNARRVLATIGRLLYRLSLRGAQAIFQNPDDRDLFIRLGLIAPARVHLVSGSGVDLIHFAPAPLPPAPVRFLLIARLLVDKGIREYVEAARQVVLQRPGVRFSLVGPRDENPSAVPAPELAAWEREGVVDYGGAVADVRPAIAAATVYVLPSYREGMPRTVLEAMAMGRPIVTTDVPGCRETVVDGLNGLLVPSHDSAALAKAMLRFVADPGLAPRMGGESRRLATERFDVTKVNQAMLAILLARPTAPSDGVRG